tara:strand:+ start:519 stop:755 length:237 start_codon:yes stop_codon:yes gene_type:complete
MTYYLLMKDDTEKDTINSTNTLGEISFNTFHTEDGFKILMNIVEHYPERLEEISIFDQKMRDYTIEEFLDKIKGLKVK